MYVGGYRALWASGVIAGLRGAAGTSIGSLFATIAVLQIPPEELETMVQNLDTDQLMDNSWFPLDDVVKFFTRLGIYRGKYLEKWCERIISRYSIANCTFSELYRRTGRHLKICVCNETLAEPEYWDHLTQPDMPIARAIRTSASLPFIYDPVDHAGSRYVDGGLCDIFPLDTFSGHETTTLGMLILSRHERKAADLVHRQPTTTLLEHACAVYTCMATTQFTLRHAHNNWMERTIALQGPGKPQWDMKFTDKEKLHWTEQSYAMVQDELDHHRRHGAFRSE
jgi:predicted acylesterase/phospholipase RssA